MSPTPFPTALALLVAALPSVGVAATEAELPAVEVVSRAPGDAPPALLRLADELEAAAAEYAGRIPLTAPPSRPVTVAVEPDFPTQARHAGQIGPAVGGGPADLHLVLHPDDGFAHRHALAAELVRRADLPELPPALARGAALWLSGDWYGRPWRDWLPTLAAADALPTTGELLAREEPGDASEVLWTPVAAAVIDALPGDTLAAKLRRRPTPAGVTATLTALAAGVAEAPPPAREAARGELPFLRGISLAMLNSVDGGYHAPAVDRQLARLADLGADAVSLMPFAYQPDPRRPAMRFLNDSPSSETDVGVIHAARRARARGFTVLWKPHLWISWDSWPGEVEMTSEADWDAWWRSYRRYVLHHAVLAAWSGAELFSVGVELSETQHREADWRRLIADVRRLYPGWVTYAGNWHAGAEEVGFWDALDLVGVDAYYPLADGPGARMEELVIGARRVVESLYGLARETGRPVLLTEVGFAARRGAWVAPHAEGGDYSEADQARAWRALIAALGRPDWLAGAFVWKAFSGETGRGERPDFRFLGREAEGVVGEWYRGEESER